MFQELQTAATLLAQSIETNTSYLATTSQLTVRLVGLGTTSVKCVVSTSAILGCSRVILQLNSGSSQTVIDHTAVEALASDWTSSTDDKTLNIGTDSASKALNGYTSYEFEITFSAVVELSDIQSLIVKSVDTSALESSSWLVKDDQVVI